MCKVDVWLRGASDEAGGGEEDERPALVTAGWALGSSICCTLECGLARLLGMMERSTFMGEVSIMSSVSDLATVLSGRSAVQ